VKCQSIKFFIANGYARHAVCKICTLCRDRKDLHTSRRSMRGSESGLKLVTRDACSDFYFSKESQEIRRVFHSLLFSALIFRTKQLPGSHRKRSLSCRNALRDLGVVFLEKRRFVKLSPVLKHISVDSTFHAYLL
jgi:hypothetical protein